MTTLNREGWSMEYGLGPGGIVLRDVKHDAFSLATTLRIADMYVRSKTPSTSDSMGLIYVPLPGGTLMPAIGGIRVLEPPRETKEQTALGWRRPDPSGMVNPSPMFGVHKSLFALTARFRTSFKLFDGTPNECTLDVEQRHLFGGYGKNPPHEPGAVLDAARLFPLVSFSLPPVKDPSKPHPVYFRVDYAIDVALDNIDEAALGKTLPRGVDTTNKGGVFRDHDGAPSVFDLAAVASFFPGSVPGAISLPLLFAAFEKPLKFEIVSRGLVEGDPSGHPTPWSKLDTWDNVHIWPAKRSSGSSADPIATPGAFHALHCHWRWGVIAGEPAGRLHPGSGWSQFQGLGWTNAAGGPLIDAAIPHQNVTFGVTSVTRQSVFGARGFEIKDPPSRIDSGLSLSLGLSFEVFRQDTHLNNPWEGTLFVNGLFFAHNKDGTPLFLKVAGAHGEGETPVAKPYWQRRAR
jgi:hypothetical protein